MEHISPMCQKLVSLSRFFLGDSESEKIVHQESTLDEAQPKARKIKAQIRTLSKKYGNTIPQGLLRPKYKVVDSPEYPTDVLSYPQPRVQYDGRRHYMDSLRRYKQLTWRRELETS